MYKYHQVDMHLLNIKTLKLLYLMNIKSMNINIMSCLAGLEWGSNIATLKYNMYP